MFEKLRHGYQLPGADLAEIQACEAALGIILPSEYKAFLRVSNGFNDAIGEGYLVLWNVAELTRAGGYELFEFQADRFLVGSNGGPTAYGVVGGSYVSIPFVFAGPWQSEVRVLGQTFGEFIVAIEAGRGG